MTNDKKKEEEKLEEESWPRDFEDVAVCCQTGCPDCPWGFNEKFDPNVSIELQLSDENNDESEPDEED